MKNRLITLLVLILSFYFFSLTKVSSASIFNKYINHPVGSPILSPTFNTWDSQTVRDPFVLYDNNIFKMWYVGLSNNKLQIGLASSVDGINWTKYGSNPVLAADNTEIHASGPTIIKDGIEYKLWYSDGLNSIRYATSTDGINWNKHGQINLPKQNWESGVHTDPTVIKENQEYKMWYTSNDGRWKISYATSSDGINWIPFQGNPVLFPSEPWEGLNTVAPSVLFDGNMYHIYYHGDGSISYASSVDGLVWNKPSEKNPAIIPGGEWDFFESMASAVMLSNGTTYLYYSGLSGSTFQIGLATDGPAPTVEPTPTVTQTPTQTPSPTPTNTPTITVMPTPVTQLTNNVVVVPGLGASWSQNGIVGCNQNVASTDWKLLPAFGDAVYNNLLKTLHANQFNSSVFAYDWRKDAHDVSPILKNHINSKVQAHQKLSLVGHSLGGLIGRAYLEEELTNNRVSKFMTIGTPHEGTPLAYLALAGGDIESNDKLWNVIMSLGIYACKVKEGNTGLSNQYILQKYFPVVYNLLPTFDYIRNVNSTTLKPFTSQTLKNSWLPTFFASPFYGTTLGTIVGTGQKTLKELNTQDRSQSDIVKGFWIDGKAKKPFITDKDGDGTILRTSALIPNAYTRTLNRDHIGIVSSMAGASEVIKFLKPIAPVSFTTQTEANLPEAALVIASLSDGLIVEENQRTISQNDDGFIVVPNPKKTKYKLTVKPKKSSSLILVGQFAKNGTIKWNNYKFNEKKAFQKDVVADTDIPVEEPLK